jgi:ABC-2 type transport system ATP-binding protein
VEDHLVLVDSMGRGPVNVINTENLSRHYGRRVGVEAVDLAVPEGEIFGFLGPNGAGKTTTIRLLLGFLRPSAGRARVFGLDCWRQSKLVKRDVGYLPGDLRLYPWMTLESALKIIGAVRGIDLAKAGRALAERFRLETKLRVRKMSRGTRQKLGLVMALAHEPRLLVLDEPTSGLDPLIRQELTACLRERAACGHTVFFSSHTLSEVEQLCDRVAIVRDGRIVADQTLQAMRRRARRSVTLEFADAASAGRIETPRFLAVTSRSDRRWSCELVGGTGELVRWAAQQPLEDIAIGPPDLESLFRRYYQNEGTVE